MRDKDGKKIYKMLFREWPLFRGWSKILGKIIVG